MSLKIAAFALVFSLLLSACTHSPRRVDCDGHLVPINPVPPKAAANK